MANLQLSGKMLHLNGSSYLKKTWPPGDYPSWSACWVRIVNKINEFPQTEWRTVLHIPTYAGGIKITYTQDLGYGANMISMSFVTPNIGKTIILGLPSWYSSTGLIAPIGSNTIDIVWNGDILCVYFNGTLVGEYSGITGRLENNNSIFNVNIGQHDWGNGVERFIGDVGDCIIHDSVPDFLADFPGYIPNANFKATEFLRLHGLTENDVLCLYDYRDPSNPGKNYGSGGSDWDLTAYGNPTILDTDFQYELVDEPPLVVSITTDKAAGYSPLEVRIEAYARGGTGNYEYSFGVSEDGGLTWAWTSWQSENFYQTTLSTYTDKEYLWKVKVRDGNSEIESEIERIMVYVRPPSTILISSSASNGIAPKTFNFTSEIPYGFPPYVYSWQWRLEGGDWTVFGSQQNAQLLFQQAGNYEVRCQVRSEGGYYYSNTLKIELNQPRIEITADKYTGDFPLEVSFTSSLTGSAEASYSFRWEYSKDNGAWQLFSQLGNPTYTFTVPGIYKIRCTVTDQYGNSDVSNEIIISEVLDVEIESDLISGIPPLTVHFTSRVKGGSAPYSYRWEYSKGGGPWIQFSTEPNPEYTFELEDRYNIRCTVTDNLGKQDVSNILKIVAMRGIPFVAHEGIQIRVKRKRI